MKVSGQGTLNLEPQQETRTYFLAPVTLMYELYIDILYLYLRTKNELYRPWLS